MQWGSLESFLSMGGRGAYVWGSYAVTALVLFAEVMLLARRHRQARQQPADDGGGAP